MTEPGDPIPAWNEPARERIVCVRPDGSPDPYAILTDAELRAMADRAWRESARCWTEYRRAIPGPSRDLLERAAMSAEAFWRETWDAVRARAGYGPSADE